MMYIHNSSTQETEVRRSQALGQPNIHSESLPQITAQVLSGEMTSIFELDFL